GPCESKLGLRISGKEFFLSLRSGAPFRAPKNAVADWGGGAHLSTYGKGLCGKWSPVSPVVSVRFLTGGTGSRPPRQNGWQRRRRQIASPPPRTGPCVAMAIVAYSEQVGTKRHPPPPPRACSAGDTHRR